MRYKTPAALEMAVRDAARRSPLDTSRAVDGFYFHRLLCRVFADPNSPFVLKGGQSMLARTVDARATRDIDLLVEGGDIDGALAELKTLAATDFGDLVSFEFSGASPIKANDDYRSGLSVTFTALLGARRVRDVSIDLVVDEIPCGHVDVLTPADRIEVAGVPVCDYRVYPPERSLADKLLAMLEVHDGRPSSRVKDLVDILVYQTRCDVEGSELADCCRLESRVRRVPLPKCFSVPDLWKGSYAPRFAKLVRQTALPEELEDVSVAETQAALLFDPVLSGACAGMRWNHETQAWE